MYNQLLILIVLLFFFGHVKKQFQDDIPIDYWNVCDKVSRALKVSIKKSSIQAEGSCITDISKKMSVSKTKITAFMKNKITDQLYPMYAKKPYVPIANLQKLGNIFGPGSRFIHHYFYNHII